MKPVNDCATPEVHEIHTTNLELLDAIVRATKSALDRNPLLLLFTESIAEISVDAVLSLESKSKERENKNDRSE